MLAAEAQWLDLLKLGTEGAWSPATVRTLKEPRTDTCALVWLNDDHHEAPTIVVRSEQLEMFYAWAATYATHLLPLSAAYEVLEWPSFEARLHARVEWMRGPWLLPALGVVQAETFGACSGDPPVSTGLTPYVSTCSWTILQRLSRFPEYANLDTICALWSEARELLRSAPTDYDLRRVGEVWRVIGLLRPGTGASDEPTITETARFVQAARAGASEALDILGGDSLLAQSIGVLSSGTIERRIEAFKALARDLLVEKSPILPAAAVGFALSLVSQGTFRHAHLVLADRVPDIRPLLWYGAFEFMSGSRTVGASTGSGVSQRLYHRLFGARTLPDLAVEELRVLSRGGASLMGAVIDLRHPLTVRLMADVDATVQPRLQAATKGERSSRQGKLF